jgi:hypothetical protein
MAALGCHDLVMVPENQSRRCRRSRTRQWPMKVRNDIGFANGGGIRSLSTTSLQKAIASASGDAVAACMALCTSSMTCAPWASAT